MLLVPLEQNLTQPKTLKAHTSNRRLYVTATFWYLKPLELYQTGKPYHINIPASTLPVGLQLNQVSEAYHGIMVENNRGKEQEFTLDRNGFQILREGDGGGASKEGGEASLSRCLGYVKARYRPEVERFLKEKLGADMAVAFAHEVSGERIVLMMADFTLDRVC